MHEIQKGLVQQFCACGDQNAEPVILMSTVPLTILNTHVIYTMFHLLYTRLSYY